MRGGCEVIVRAVEDAVVAVVTTSAHGVLVKLHRRLAVVLRVDALHGGGGGWCYSGMHRDILMAQADIHDDSPSSYGTC